MARLSRVLSAAVIMSAGAALVPSSAQARTGAEHDERRPRSRRGQPVTQVARLSTGTIPALSAMSAASPSPAPRSRPSASRWRSPRLTRPAASSTESLPAGEYVVKAHLAGFSASRREVVRVGEASTAVPLLQVRRLDAPRPRRRRTVRSQPSDRCRPGSACRRRNRPATKPKTGDQGRAPAFRDRVASAPHQAQHPEGPFRTRSSWPTTTRRARRPRCSAARWAAPPTSPATRLRSSRISRSPAKSTC